VPSINGAARITQVAFELQTFPFLSSQVMASALLWLVV
jgi:hypothetical protein